MKALTQTDMKKTCLRRAFLMEDGWMIHKHPSSCSGVQGEVEALQRCSEAVPSAEEFTRWSRGIFAGKHIWNPSIKVVMEHFCQPYRHKLGKTPNMKEKAAATKPSSLWDVWRCVVCWRGLGMPWGEVSSVTCCPERLSFFPALPLLLFLTPTDTW